MSNRWICIITFLAIVVSTSAVYADVSQLVTRVPQRSNAVVVIDVQTVLASPMARQENWGESRRHAQTSGMIGVPSELNWFLMAAEIDFEFMQPIWEIALAQMPKRPTMKEVAEYSGGRLDRLAGTEAVERPNDSYVVAYGPKIVGAMSPANRQQVIRWVRQSQAKKSPDLSPYLADAVDFVQRKQAHMVLGFDLAGLLAADEISKELPNSEVVEDSSLEPSALAETLASIQGVRMEIVFKDSPQATLRVTFENDATALEPIAGTLLAEILAKHGARMQDIPKWKVQAVRNELLFSGTLSESGLRRVISVLSGPVGPWTKPAGYTSAETAKSAMGETSQRYFQSVTGYLDDLFVDNVTQPQSLYQVEVWMERYARQIENLDTSGVDPDVVTFADDVVIRLREIGNSLQRAQQRSDLRESTMWNYGRSRYGRYGAYGFFEKGYVTRDRHLIQADEGLRGLSEGNVIVNEMRALSAETRRTMTERYGIQF